MFSVGHSVYTNGFLRVKKMITKEYNEIIRAAKAGGEIAKKYFGKVLEVEGKSMPCDFRTKADLEAEKAILKILKKGFPEYNIVSEEGGGTNKNSEYTFYVDPIDGTNNFVLGIPYFSTGIALFKGEEMVFSAVYEPVLGNIYYAQKGKGAFKNKKTICANKESDIKNSTVAYARNYKTPIEHSQKIIKTLEDRGVKRPTRFWSLILDFCLLAAGKQEAVITYGEFPVWDIAPGKLIAREAGALITNYNGQKDKDKNTFLLATNGTKIHQEILQMLNSK